jgi:hypothetical protein
MSTLSYLERMKFEKLFGMATGYVLDFSNRTFERFVWGSTRIDVYEEKYDYQTGSKANRLRAFWTQEPNQVVGTLLLDLLEYWKTLKLGSHSEIAPSEQQLFDECQDIATRLRQDTEFEHVDVIQPYSDDKDFDLLARSIRDSIENGEPEVALDRLHTFVVKYVRQLCGKHEISYDKSQPLHSLFGGYVKSLKSSGAIESEMTERILKSSISVLDAFNEVRNNRSFAHDNPILNYSESVLIFNHISSAIRFIESIESGDTEEDQDPEVTWDDLPF